MLSKFKRFSYLDHKGGLGLIEVKIEPKKHVKIFIQINFGFIYGAATREYDL